MTNKQHTPLFDPGLQPERTQLSWDRTALSFVVNAALLARYAREAHPAQLVHALAVAFLVSGVSACTYGRASYHRRCKDLLAGEPSVREGALRMLWATSTGLIIGCLVLTVSVLA